MKKEYKKAHEQSVLNIGEFYLVAHVNVKNAQSMPPINIDVPIIPIWHNDEKDFGFKHSHYHIDGRFLTNKSKQSRIWNVTNGFTSGVITNENHNVLSEVFFMRKKCLRLDTGVHSVNFHAPNFNKKYLGKSCKGRKCPHWGTVMNEVDGILVCPMHRLKGDIAKEVII